MGNKIDDAEKRQVNTEEGQQKAEELNIRFVETSAKVGINVKQLFKDLANTLPGVGSATPTTKPEEENTQGGFKLGGENPYTKDPKQQAEANAKPKRGCKC